MTRVQVQDLRGSDVDERFSVVPAHEPVPIVLHAYRAVHIKIDRAVVVEIAPGTGVVPRVDREAEAGSHVQPGPIALWGEQPVRAIVREKEIEFAVPVEVDDAGTNRPLCFVSQGPPSRAQAGQVKRLHKAIPRLEVQSVCVAVHVGDHEVEWSTAGIESDRSHRASRVRYA